MFKLSFRAFQAQMLDLGPCQQLHWLLQPPFEAWRCSARKAGSLRNWDCFCRHVRKSQHVWDIFVFGNMPWRMRRGSSHIGGFKPVELTNVFSCLFMIIYMFKRFKLEIWINMTKTCNYVSNGLTPTAVGSFWSDMKHPNLFKCLFWDRIWK